MGQTVTWIIPHKLGYEASIFTYLCILQETGLFYKIHSRFVIISIKI